MTLREFQTMFDRLPATQFLRCTVCGFLGRNGCAHQVVNFTPEVLVAGVPSAGGGCLEMEPQRTEIQISSATGLPIY